MRFRRFAVLAVMGTVVSSCEKQPEKVHFTLLEAIALHGFCKEDHATIGGVYDATAVRHRNDQTKAVESYGYATLSGDFATRAFAEVQHPTAYQPPDNIEFLDIALDTSQQHWTIHGVSQRGDEGHEYGYDSTCELDVVKRGTKLEDVDPVFRALETTPKK